jgi:glucuronoarabinoxylan endo-1,4-beta-xylanase
VNGGSIVDGSRQAWANSIASFVSNMQSAGINIYAVSAQNEPDATISTYESCTYTASALATFIGTYLGPALASSGVKIMGPETQNWCGFKSYADAIMNNSSAASAVSIIATHEYGCADTAHVVPYTTGISAGKEFWETEVYDQGSSTADPGMSSALRVVTLIHNAIAIANMNAWHYWWVYGGGNGALWDQASNKPAKRLYVMGNYSRFVRPGYQRVSTSGTVPSGVLVSAYKNPTDGTVAVVAVNSSNSAASLSVFMSGAAPCSVTPWVTSAADSLASKTAVVVTNSRFTFSLGAQSVTTFVGKP